jgi:hypothetical protein
MIVQQVPHGTRPIIICNVDHALAAGQLAEAFGKAQFAKPVPSGLLAFVARHHEEGWRPLDARPRRNPATGLPYHLGETPADLLIQKSVASPDFNERHHPWCGLLSSMHAWGLYHQRYGISNAVSIDQRPTAHAEAIAQMLEGERARQDRLRAVLRSDSATASWVEEEALMTAYKLLEFFDTLALWWQLSHSSLRQPACFTHVPAAIGEDRTLDLVPTGSHSARLTPYPFAHSPLVLRCRVRSVVPAANDAEFAAAIASGITSWQHCALSAD